MKTVKEILSEGYEHSLIKGDDIEGQYYQSKADTRRPAKFPPEKDIPNVLTLVRKAIRVFPDNQKIALYYSYALDKYLSVPYGPNNKAMGIHLNEAKKPEFEPGTEKELQDYYTSSIDPKNKKIKRSDIIGSMHPRDATKFKGGTRIKLAKILTSKDMSGPEMTGAVMGTLIAKGITTAGKAVSKIGSMMKKEEVSASERFKNNLKHIREQKELVDEGVGDYLDAGAEAIVPYYSAGKKLYKGDYKGAAKDALTDTALLAVGGAAGKLAYGGIKAARGLTKASRASKAATKAADAAGRDASAIAGKVKKTRVKSTPKPKKAPGSGPGLGTRLATSDLTTDQGSGSRSTSEPISSLFKQRQQERGFREAGRAEYMPSDDPGRELRTQREFGARKYTAVKESTNFDKIKTIAESKKTDVVSFNDITVTINNRIAKKIVTLYESLNEDNKQKIETLLNENVNSFRKVINFALRQ